VGSAEGMLSCGFAQEFLALGRFDEAEREFLIDNSLVRVHVIIVMIRWTGLAPWEFAFPFPGSLASIFAQEFLALGRFDEALSARQAKPETLNTRKSPAKGHFRLVDFCSTQL